MPNLDWILEVLLNDDKVKNSKVLQSLIYRDEPILKSASQMKKPETPEKIRQMRRLADSPDAYWRPARWLFYTQGKFMEDYEDDYDFDGEVVQYYPTYQELTTRELRGYFTWRTQVRRGIYVKTSLSFTFLYLYELLSQIGVSSPEDGFRKLKAFDENYGELDPRVERYLLDWMKDYVIYYGLDSSLLSWENGRPAQEVLLHSGEHSDAEVFAALAACSTYRIENSRFYKSHKEDVEVVARRVFDALCAYFQKHRKRTFPEYLFGPWERIPYTMFRAAVFYDPVGRKNCEYVVSETERYFCRNGYWSCERFGGAAGKSVPLGAIFKTLDRVLRETSGYGYPIKPEAVSKSTLAIIEKTAEEYWAEKKKAAAPKIDIDLSRLGAIRRASDSTRDKLLVDEESEETAVLPAKTPVPAPQTRPAGLSEEEYRFLHSLLYGGTEEKLGLLSVLADGVNEKLFDRFCDTVIEFDGDTPVVIDDYADELKGMIEL